ncbi:hypothetical protein [Halobacillus sp. K22]|uniref:hypothetical protein n=1 Tax=Halobacillus sp. K22 TaxID=3457431 RepID=UPI003FCCC719
MLVQVEWINYHKKTELDRPQLFRITDNIHLEQDTLGEDQLREAAKEKIASQEKLPKENIEIVQCLIVSEKKSG